MKIDRVHFYVEDAIASRDWFIERMGFQPWASGASRHTRTTIVKSGAIYIVLSSPITKHSPVAEFLRLHPPGVVDIAFLVPDLAVVMERLVKKGVKILETIQERSFSQGYVKSSKIAAWGTLNHTILEYKGISKLWAISTQLNWIEDPFTLEVYPDVIKGKIARSPSIENHNIATLFNSIDHVVLNVAAGDLGQAVEWYRDVLGFQPQQMFTIQTETSGLGSQVMIHPDSGVQLPINEPTSANSQIQEFLDVNRGAGIQHIALATDNIVAAIAQLRHRGLSFIEVSLSYYTGVKQRCNLSVTEWDKIIEEKILVDSQDDSPQSLLLQTFTQPIFKQPTFFFEIIERRLGAKGFGEGNFRALFEAIEREQLKRGKLKLKIPKN